MAELGDLLTGGSRAEDVTIEMLDYDFLNKCTDHGLIRAIVLKLKSGEEGHYPQLVKHAETRLLQELPQPERSKILRMKAEPQPDEIYEAASDLHSWEEEIAKLSSKLNERNCLQQNAPKWTSCDQAETKSRTPKVVELASHDENSHGDRPQLAGVGPERTGAKKIDAYDFRAWENYDADGEIRRMESDEEEQQTMEHEAITSAKARTEQDQQRRAKLRENQLREAVQGRFKESLSSFEKKRTSQREHMKGNESFNAKEYDESFRCYTLAIALDDANAKLYSNRAAAAHKLQRFEQAEDDCTRAISFDAEFKRAWMRRGMVRYSRGKYAGSVADFTECVRLDPSDTKAFKLRELTAAKQRQVEGDPAGKTNGGVIKKRRHLLIEEVDTLQELEMDVEELDFAELTPAILAAPAPTVDGKRTMIAHGWMEVASNDLKRSGTRIQVLDSVDEQVLRRVMVSCDSSDEDYKDAAKYAGIVPEDPEDTDRINNLVAKARALYNAGDYNAAVLAFREAQECDPLAPGRYQHANNLSACMLRLEDYEGALKYTKLVLAVDPGNVKAALRQWLALKKLGKSDEGDSASLLSRLASSDERNGETAAHMNAVAADEGERQDKCDELRTLGNEMMRTGHQDDAVGMYTAALKENPSDTRASNNRAQAYLNLKRYADAEKDATVVLQADPGNMKASYRRGRARLNLPRPDKEGGCRDLARVVSNNPKNHEAINCLACAVEGMDLDVDGGDVFPEEDNCSKTPEEERAKADDETPTGSGTSGFEMAVEDTEVATQPSAGAHGQTKRRPGPLRIVEDDENGGCSWCPLVVDEREEDRQAFVGYWRKGEYFRQNKLWAQALQLFTQGVVANPSDANCWIGLSRVHREQGNYKESLEAATRAQNAAPTRAFLCKAVTGLNENKEMTELQRAEYVRGVWLDFDELIKNSSNARNDLEGQNLGEEWAILTAILPPAEIRH